MALYQKVPTDPADPTGPGTWVLCKRPYVKYNNVYTAAKTAHIKVNGVWVRAWTYDATPPDKPLIDLILHEDFMVKDGKQVLKSRWIRVGVRQPQPNHDPDTAMIRVLTDYNDKAPTTQFGGTYTSTPDTNYPAEPWSEWRYGDGFPHPDNSKLIYKQWPRNATDGTQLKGDNTYHFGAWAVDGYGNWSGATQASLHIPKGGVDEPTVHLKEVTFAPNSSGSWASVKFGSGRRTQWVAGHLEQQKSPRSQGLLFYGGQFKDNLTTNSTIKTAQIYLYRTTAGQNAVANIYLFWMSTHNPTNLPAPGGTIDPQQTRFIGTLAKGQGRWFDIPGTFNSEFKNGNLKCMGLAWKDPDKSDSVANDYSQVAGGNFGGCGNVHMVWEEPV
jgi:hypothetical protein